MGLKLCTSKGGFSFTYLRNIYTSTQTFFGMVLMILKHNVAAQN
jgi:hypothetical protein